MAPEVAVGAIEFTWNLMGSTEAEPAARIKSPVAVVEPFNVNVLVAPETEEPILIVVVDPERPAVPILQS